MAFGRPTRYLQLDLNRIPTTSSSNNIRAIWDKSVEQASDEYKKRMVIKIKSLLLFQLLILI
jgi:hypothetical protein